MLITSESLRVNKFTRKCRTATLENRQKKKEHAVLY